MTETIRSQSPAKMSPARIIGIVFSVLGIFVFQQFASKVGALGADSLDYRSIDPYGAFMANCVHHVIQALIALVLILLLAKLLRIDFGFRAGEVRLGLKLVGIMSAVLFVYMIISYVVGYAFDLVQPYAYPLTARNISGTLAFQLFLSGPTGFSFRYDVIQLVFAFALGTVQGFVFLKTKSVFYSMAIHSISNILAVGGGYWIVIFIL